MPLKGPYRIARVASNAGKVSDAVACGTATTIRNSKQSSRVQVYKVAGRHGLLNGLCRSAMRMREMIATEEINHQRGRHVF